MDAILNLTREILDREISFLMLYSDWCPMIFAGLVHEDEVVNQSTREYLSALFTRWSHAEVGKHEDEYLGSVLDRLYWCDNPFAVETLYGLAECQFLDTPEDIKVRVRGMSDGPCATKIAEDLFNFVRRVSSLHLSGVCSPLAQFHAAVFSGLLEDSGLRQGLLEAEDRIGPYEPLSKAMCKATTNEFSLGEDALNSYMDGTDFPVPDAQGYMDTPMLQHALVNLPNLGDLHGLWRSILWRKGDVLLHKDGLLDPDCYWVLSSNEYGARVFHCKLLYVGGNFLDLEHKDETALHVLAHDSEH